MQQRHRSYLYPAAMAAVTAFAVYLPALRNGFLNWDDDVNVIANEHLRSPFSTFLTWAFTSISQSFWQPVNWLSYALDHALWGLAPAGYHLTNILFHAVNTFLVVVLAMRVVDASRAPQPVAPAEGAFDRALPIGEEIRSRTAGLVAGLLFALHPLHVESVAWISGRTDLLCTLFFLLSLLCYLGAAADRQLENGVQATRSDLRNGPFLLSLLFFLLALASKPSAVVLPGVLLLLDWYPLRRMTSPKRAAYLLWEKFPFMVLSIIISVVTVISQRPLGVMAGMESVPLTSRLLVACRALVLYLTKMAAPLHLLPIYPYPEGISFWSAEYLGSLTLVCGTTATALFLARKRPWLLAGWGYFLITLVPMLGVISARSEPMADRYTYLSSLGPFLLVGAVAGRLEEWVYREHGGDGSTRRIIMTVAVVAALALSYVTVRQIGIWNNSVGFWTSLIEQEPVRVPIAYVNRGVIFKEQGRVDRALSDYDKVIALSRGAGRTAREGRATSVLEQALYLAYNDRALVYEEQGRIDRALADYADAISLHPKAPLAYYNRGMLYAASGRIDLAIEDMTTVVKVDPGYADAYTMRGSLYRMSGRFEPALADYSAVIQRYPDRAPGYFNRGLLFGEAGRADRALSDYTRAIDLDPAYAAAYTNRGLLFEDRGQYDRALADLNAAIRCDPSGAAAYNNRGLLFERTDRLDRAVEDYSRAIALDPADALAYSNRGTAYGRMGRHDLAVKDFRTACGLGDQGGCAAAQRAGKAMSEAGQ